MSNKLKTNVLGFPRIGKDRELKKAEEAFWAGKISKDELIKVSKEIKEENWKRQKYGEDAVKPKRLKYVRIKK